ncbi:MAG: hypothetical protein KF724_03165 [Phycisphaeraceae bacterium]|nr:hypothetical protein [Phycisphaeraceae bacterium]
MTQPRPQVDPGLLRPTLAWVRAWSQSPEWAVADLVARELEPRCEGAIDLITSPDTSLTSLVKAKSLFKELRMEGDTLEERKLASQLYALTIAAALVRFDEFITRQRRASIKQAFQHLTQDDALPWSLRELARVALARCPGVS